MAHCMMSSWSVAALSGAGLAGAASVHCLTMCGPLSAATRAQGGRSASFPYLAGRLGAYAVLGMLAGSVGQGLLALTPWARAVEAALAWGLSLVLLHAALSAFGLLKPSQLVRLGTKPRRSLVSLVLARVAHEPLLLGVATSLLPCAALYGALLASAALGDGGKGALLMLTFALLTSPALFFAAELAGLTRLGLLGRRAFGALLVVGAVLTALRPLPSLRAPDAAPACPLHAHAQDGR